MDQDESFPSQITAKKDSQEVDIPLDGTCLRDKTNKLKVCAAVVSTLSINDYLQNTYVSNDQM
jgi:hypothetical protein